MFFLLHCASVHHGQDGGRAGFKLSKTSQWIQWVVRAVQNKNGDAFIIVTDALFVQASLPTHPLMHPSADIQSGFNAGFTVDAAAAVLTQRIITRLP